MADIFTPSRTVRAARAICSVLSSGDTCCELAPVKSCHRDRYMEAAEAVIEELDRDSDPRAVPQTFRRLTLRRS